METHFKNIKFLTKRNFVILMIVMLLGGFYTAHALTKEVIIKDGDKVAKVEGIFFDVGGAIKKGKIILNEHDQLSKPDDSKVKNGMLITVKRAQPVNIQVDSKSEEIMTANEKVKDILDEYHISVGEKDIVLPALDENVGKYETIKVVRVEEKIVTEKESIPYKSVIKYNDALEEGTMNVVEKGKNGKREAKYKVVYEDGVVVSRELIKENILEESKDAVVEKGTAMYVATARGKLRVKKFIKMTATAYDATFESCGKYPSHPEYGITRSGTKVRPGVVAVDPRVIPLGSKLYVKALDGSKDYGIASAEDTGGAIKGKRIDLYYESPKDVARYGKRKVMVYVLE
ncbi:G5 domain-containing protein [Crassaminicella profunda]|uniref:G5 domain-containing protein n=1 Tax=Crassaminicella profunda TaxID=1286698 RepID=UPI001CA61B35|nr:G5 domain-containing protein [Crassaminicella profunda]QZY55352.1 G5 domain-containing protein [Crassaminicella profunda]